MKAALWQLADLLFPSRCALCGQHDHSTSVGGNAYCPTCIGKLCPEPQNRCQRCAAEVGPYAKSDGGCAHCRKRRYRFNSVVCLGMYEGSLRRALLAAKWSFSAVRMRSLGAILAAARSLELATPPYDRIVPIPQHWQQRLVRHFNPAWIIAQELSVRCGAPCDIRLLKKTQQTRPQKRVSVRQRFDNQNGTLGIKDPQVVRGERILIVDDVLTTGATCSEAARVLNAAGAKSCDVAVLARVLDHSA